MNKIVAFVLLVSLGWNSAIAEDTPSYIITGNQIANSPEAHLEFDRYIKLARPMMVEEGVEFALLDVLDTLSGDAEYFQKGDILAFTTSKAGGLDGLFAREDFQAIFPILQSSLRGHWGYPVAADFPSPRSFEKDATYIFAATEENCPTDQITESDMVLIGRWTPINNPKQPKAFKHIELRQQAKGKPGVGARSASHGDCTHILLLGLRDIVATE